MKIAANKSLNKIEKTTYIYKHIEQIETNTYNASQILLVKNIVLYSQNVGQLENHMTVHLARVEFCIKIVF